jgi:hypothetical protein
LLIKLRSPWGAEVLLSDRRGGSGDNFQSTVFSDEAATAISTGSAPFTGTYRPEQALSAFDGRSVRGTWQLIIQDLASSDTGILKNWNLLVDAFGGVGGQQAPDSSGVIGAAPLATGVDSTLARALTSVACPAEGGSHPSTADPILIEAVQRFLADLDTQAAGEVCSDEDLSVSLSQSGSEDSVADPFWVEDSIDLKLFD